MLKIVLCFSLVFATTLVQSGSQSDQLLDSVSKDIVADISSSNPTSETIPHIVKLSIKKHTPEIKHLARVVGDNDLAAQMVATKVVSDDSIISLLKQDGSSGSIQDRFVGASIMGVLKLLSDGVGVALTRY